MIVLQENPHLARIIRSRLEGHYKADEIIKGVYWEDGKGCAIGCITESSKPYTSPIWHDIGIGLFIPRLVDTIFEGLPDKLAKEWPLQFWTAIESAIGKDLGLVHWKFLHWVISEELKQFQSHEIVGKSITSVIDGLALLAVGKNWADAAAADAADAADAAYAAYAIYATYAADDGRAARAADAADAARAAAARAADAAHAAAYDARATYDVANAATAAAYAYAYADAARAAARAADAAADADAAYGRQANKLIELIETAY